MNDEAGVGLESARKHIKKICVIPALTQTMKSNMVECSYQNSELVGTFWQSLRKLQLEGVWWTA